MPKLFLPRDNNQNYSLGIDLGSNSIGLALIESTHGAIIHTTARVFPAGMQGNENDWENGKEASNAAQRRDARGQRRQTDRRRRRLRKLAHILQGYDWLPSSSDSDFQKTLNAWDASRAAHYNAHLNLPYFLRARGLDHSLELQELGRALFHLAQRRGFKSNRKSAPKADEKPGEVQASIDSISQAMAATGKRTLGEYFASLNPHEAKVRRNRTSRKMYLTEFDLLWDAQAAFHPADLTAERRAAIHAAIFFQRPLKDQSHLIGHCELIPTERRAPVRSLAFQRFRFLDALNNLRLYTPEGLPHDLSPQDREKIIARLQTTEKLKFTDLKKLLGLKASYKFSIEEGGAKHTPGNATAARIFEKLPVFWNSLNAAQRDDLVEDLGGRFEDDEALANVLESKWGLSPEESLQISKLRLPDTYASLSLEAIARVLPDLEQGLAFSAARKRRFPETDRLSVHDLLPPVKEVFPEIRNPAVLRSLTEMRKCVNAFIREYGKPDELHIELARDLRRNKRERLEMTARNNKNKKLRDEAEEYLKSAGRTHISGSDIEKYILWKECSNICPYSGHPISYQALFDQAQFEIEHIIPYSRSLDNGFPNKTLCHIDYNRRKSNLTPFEAFGQSEAWDDMVNRVKTFNNRAKLARFVMTEQDTDKILKDFTERQLTDTKYASKLAARYLQTLYGGRSDEGGQRVFTCAGAITAMLRRIWDMNRVLNEKPEKSRDDHRHHAVDAVAIALASPKYIKAISDAVARSWNPRPIRSALLADPWLDFRRDLRTKILDETQVSYRPTRKLAGPLHEETFYSKPKLHEGKQIVHIRKAVPSLTLKDIDDIVDPSIQEAVRTKFLDSGSAWKNFDKDPPRMKSGVPIKSVRLRRATTTFKLGSSAAPRSVISGDNHHMEVIAILGPDGQLKSWRAEIVSRFEANARLAAKKRQQLSGLQVVRRQHGDNERFEFSLSEGDVVSYQPKDSSPALFKVRGVTTQAGGRLALSAIHDARLKAEIVKSKDLLSPTINVFMRGKGRKLLISHTGEVVDRND